MLKLWRRFVSTTVGLALTIGGTIWLALIITFQAVNLSAWPGDAMIFPERFDQGLQWLFSTPGWVPGLIILAGVGWILFWQIRYASEGLAGLKAIEEMRAYMKRTEPALSYVSIVSRWNECEEQFKVIRDLRARLHRSRRHLYQLCADRLDHRQVGGIHYDAARIALTTVWEDMLRSHDNDLKCVSYYLNAVSYSEPVDRESEVAEDKRSEFRRMIIQANVVDQYLDELEGKKLLVAGYLFTSFQDAARQLE